LCSSRKRAASACWASIVVIGPRYSQTVTSSSARPYALGREAADDGSFRRQDSSFRNWVSDDGDAEFPLEGRRYHLYVSRACPWAHRTLIGRRLMGLEHAIGVSFVDPIRDERGWAFTGGDHVDQVNQFEFLREAYVASDPSYDLHVTVPVMWDKQAGAIVNNESADILRMVSTVFTPLAEHPFDLYPHPLREEIDELNAHIYENVNDAVYRAGFARRQEIYEREVQTLFATLDQLNGRLSTSRFLFGPQPVETDIRLFTTLVRFDAVYQIHFKCSLRKLIEYEHLWPYTRDLYQWPGIRETVDFDEIRAHYYCTHPMINPSGIVAAMPLASFEAPHGREALS
jgi:glutathionyl-hydroquinone reductase